MDQKLQEEARQGSLKYVNELIRKGADVNYGMYGAAGGGNKELVEFFIHKGAWDWNWGMRGAAEGGYKELVDLFVKKGANDWNYGMYGAAQGGHKELVDLFVKKGANDWNGGMYNAAYGGNKELVDLFVKNGAKNWNLGMYYAVEGGHKELVQLFIEHGANNLNYGMCIAAEGGNKELVDLFVEHGANDWNTGLAYSENISLKIFFIDHGADNIAYFPLFYKDICVKFNLPNGALINKLLRRYIALFKGSKLRNEKVIINDIYETTLDQVFISPPGTIVKFRNETHVIKGHIFYLAQSRNPHFKQSRNPQFKRYVHETDFDECHIIKKLKIY